VVGIFNLIALNGRGFFKPKILVSCNKLAANFGTHTTPIKETRISIWLILLLQVPCS